MPRFPKLLLMSLLTGLTSQVFAQTTPADTTRLSYGEEVTSSATADAPLRVQQEERSLWKLGLNNFTLGSETFGYSTYYTRYGVHVAYEHKLQDPAWTVQGEVSPAVIHYRLEGKEGLTRALSVRTQVATRYYHNLARRQRQGHSAGNFSANYVSVALGAGLGRQALESPFYFFLPNNRRLARFDAALLYGVQRRLGRYGFVDANAGLTSLLTTGKRSVQPNASLRIGLAISSLPAPAYTARPLLAEEDEALRPRVYVGAQMGSYSLRKLRPFGRPINVPGAEYIPYNQEVKSPYLYAGVYLRPRWAVQVGVLGQDDEYRSSASTGGALVSSEISQDRVLAIPLQVRYALTRSFLQRVQFDIVGGVIPMWSSVLFQEQLFTNGELTTENNSRYDDFGMHATVGLNVSYGIGRRRRVQLTGEYVGVKDLRTNFEGLNKIQAGGSLGLRYRFGYR